jgi:deazaflavin-dependent oxidoreductase (nitroreductase family)
MQTTFSPGVVRRIVRAVFGASGYLYIWLGRVSPRAKDAALKRFSAVHVAVYRRTGGRRAFEPGAPSLLLTVSGRRSGEPRTSPLFYLPDGERFVLCASYSGDDRNPQWFLNLMAAGEATVRVGSAEHRVKAELVGAEERTELWPRLVATWPSYEVYQRQTTRELPVIALTPIGGSAG